MFTSCCTLSFTVESMASNNVRTPVNLVAWLSLDRLWLLDQWNNVLQMNGDRTSECPIKPKWGYRRTSIDVLHTSMEVRTSKEVRTLICGRPLIKINIIVIISICSKSPVLVPHILCGFRDISLHRVWLYQQPMTALHCWIPIMVGYIPHPK